MQRIKAKRLKETKGESRHEKNDSVKNEKKKTGKNNIIRE